MNEQWKRSVVKWEAKSGSRSSSAQSRAVPDLNTQTRYDVRRTNPKLARLGATAGVLFRVSCRTFSQISILARREWSPPPLHQRRHNRLSGRFQCTPLLVADPDCYVVYSTVHTWMMRCDVAHPSNVCVGTPVSSRSEMGRSVASSCWRSNPVLASSVSWDLRPFTDFNLIVCLSSVPGIASLHW